MRSRLNIGVRIDDDIISVLIHTDNIVLLCKNENDLQRILDNFNLLLM